MEKSELIRSFDVFAALSEREDCELVTELVKRGLALEDAERVVALLPIAFGREVIRRIGKVEFSDVFTINSKTGIFQLSEEPIYRAAAAIADSSSDFPVVSKEDFSTIALRSAELSAANKALNALGDISGAEFGPVVLWGYKTF